MSDAQLEAAQVTMPSEPAGEAMHEAMDRASKEEECIHLRAPGDQVPNPSGEELEDNRRIKGGQSCVFYAGGPHSAGDRKGEALQHLREGHAAQCWEGEVHVRP